jgi:restriction system protein
MSTPRLQTDEGTQGDGPTVLLIEDEHTFESNDGVEIWQGGFTPIDADGGFLSEGEHKTSHPRCFFSRIAGVSYRRTALQRENLIPGSQILLRPEPENEHDRHAIGVWDQTGTAQLGYIPRDLCSDVHALVPAGSDLAEAVGGFVLSEFREGTDAGQRLGLRILVGLTGEITLSIRSDDDDDDENVDDTISRFTATQVSAPAPGTFAVVCPACGSNEHAIRGASGYRCRNCQNDVWFLRCHRCHDTSSIFGTLTGSGSIEFRCGKCRAKNVIAKQNLRAINAEVKRRERAIKAAEQASAAQHKAAKAREVEQTQHEADRRNRDLARHLEAMETTLTTGIAAPTLTFADLKKAAELPKFVPGPLASEEPPPSEAEFVPPEVHGLASLVPGAKRKSQQDRSNGLARFQEASAAHEQREEERMMKLEQAKHEHQRRVAAIEQKTEQQHTEIEELEARFAGGDPEAVMTYLHSVAAACPLPFEPVAELRIGFSPESRQAVVEMQLPDLSVIPEARAFRFVKARGEITSTAMPMSERRKRYGALIAQLALLVPAHVFGSDPHNVIDTVVFNGHVATIDKRTGQPSNPCLVTVRATSDRFSELNLSQVDPVECLKGLSASISRSPAELVPVRPVIEFNMADPRFVTEEQIIGTLDTRPNLMELTPKEFESLITNLFEKMGLETRLTQPSRDGGVDCVAYDARPIFGGKVVIQAKRYKNTVGVSAVRDLYGTMQNEGATKGILVTTSGYGQASHEFANGKPLELIDGGNLLYLLHEHADVDAKIEPPDDWKDPEEPH